MLLKYSNAKNSIIKQSNKIDDLFCSCEMKKMGDSGQDVEQILKTAIIASDDAGIDSDNRIYFRNRAISSGGEYEIKPIRPNVVLAKELTRHFGSNDNGDYFPGSELNSDMEEYGYKTFVKPAQARRCVNHDFAENDSRTIGRVIASWYRNEDYPKGQYVELISYVDKKLAHKIYPGILDAIEADLLTDTSMGVWCEASICSECGNLARENSDFCNHVLNKISSRKRGSDIHEINIGLQFFEDSFIGDPSLWTSGYSIQIPVSADLNAGADPDAKILERIACKRPVFDKPFISGQDLFIPAYRLDDLEVENMDTGKRENIKIAKLRIQSSDAVHNITHVTEGDYVKIGGEPDEYAEEKEDERTAKEQDFEERREQRDNEKRFVVFESPEGEVQETEAEKGAVVFEKQSSNIKFLGEKAEKRLAVLDNSNVYNAFAVDFNDFDRYYLVGIDDPKMAYKMLWEYLSGSTEEFGSSLADMTADIELIEPNITVDEFNKVYGGEHVEVLHISSDTHLLTKKD